MKRTYYNKNNEKYMRAQFSMFQEAVNKIFQNAQSNGITIEVVDFEKLLSDPDPDSVLLDIYLRPIEKFKKELSNATSLKLMISEQEKPYRQAAFSLTLVLSDLKRYSYLDLDFSLLNWNFENIGKSFSNIVSVDKDILDKCIKDKCTITLSDTQSEKVELVESFCQFKNKDFDATQYLEWSYDDQKFIIDEQHLMSDVLNM